MIRQLTPMGTPNLFGGQVCVNIAAHCGTQRNDNDPLGSVTSANFLAELVRGKRQGILEAGASRIPNDRGFPLRSTLTDLWNIPADDFQNLKTTRHSLLWGSASCA
jgi:hypothetical protein